MCRTLTYSVTDKDAGIEILDFLRSHGFSRHLLSSMKNDPGCIRLNEDRGFGHTLLKEGDILTILLREMDPPSLISPVKMDLQILFEDQDLLVLNKPADMPVHPSAGNYENTLANGVSYYFASKEQPFVYRCINRLDRDTSGVLVLAKNALSAAVLSQQMKARQIKRTYLAIVTGITPEHGTIDAPIARENGSAITRIVDFQNGEKAVTHYERLAVHAKRSLLALRLDTGRTHQIRVHMKYLGFPLPGDYLYNPDYRIIHRQPLHSYQLEFTHPVTGSPLLFTAPVPQDFASAFTKELS